MLLHKTLTLYLYLSFNTVYTFSQEDTLRKRSIKERNPEEIVDAIWSKIHTSGHWTSWGPWTCDAICGSGVSFRKRICIGSGEFGIPICKGLALDRGGNNCTVNCPPIEYLRNRIFGQRITPFEKQFYDQLLQSSNALSFSRKPGEKIRFDCDNAMNLKLLVNYTGSVLFWSKNENPVWYDFRRMKLDKYSILELDNLTTNDTGVYTCQIKLPKNLTLTISVFSLTVAGDKIDHFVHVNQKILVTCNSMVLGKLYSNLNAQWIMDGTDIIIKDYRSTSPDKVNVDQIGDLKYEYTGLWSCLISDHALNRKWKTNSFRVKILPPSIVLLTYLQTYFSTLTISIIGGTTLLLVIVTAVTAMVVERKRRLELLAELNSSLKACDQFQPVEKASPGANTIDDEDQPKEIDVGKQSRHLKGDSFELQMKEILEQIESQRKVKSSVVERFRK